MKNLIPLSLFIVLSTCSGANDLGRLMIDAGEVLAEAGTGNAQTGPSRVLTADTDLSRLEQAIASLGPDEKLSIVTGPIVITTLVDGFATGGGSVYVWLAPEATPCDQAAVNAFRVQSSLVPLLVKQGQHLCARSISSGGSPLLWSGFRPY